MINLRVKAGILLLFLIITSCSKQNDCGCFTATGNMSEEVRVVQDFNRIDIGDNIDVYLHQDSVCSVKVIAGANLLNNITTESSAGTLVLRNTNSCNWVRNMQSPVSVYLSVPDLTSISYKGYGNVTALDTLFTHELTVNIFDGSGSFSLLLKNTATRLNVHQGVVDVHLSGRTGVSYIYHNGIGPVDALDLPSDITFITNNSIGNSFVNVGDTLEASIFYHGDIYYKGHPAFVRSTISSSGQLISY